MTDKTMPALRFRGFYDAWEQRKLSDLTERVTRKNKNNESSRPLTISAQNGLIDQNDFFGKQIASRDVSGYFLVKNGEFAYNKSYSNGYPWGAIKRLNNYDMGVLSTLYIVFRPINISSQFLVYYYDTSIWHKEIAKNAAEGARNHGLLNIAPVDFFGTSLVIPNSIEEQQKIGLIFKQLDNLITQNEHKTHLLKQLKQAYLQKVFSQKLRFAGFSDDWKECKVSDIADRLDNSRIPITSSDRISGDTPYYGANGIQDYVEGFTHDGEFILVAEDGANDLKNYPVQYVNGKAWINNHAHVLQGKKTVTDNKFLMNAIKNFNIEPFLVGGGRAKLNADIMMKINIQSPSYEEQQKVGSFFQQLDNLIALHQQKLNLLKKQKQAFLQKMFI
ncbi:restriction endonuclease subunit S [Leuconostoc mesenteroides subsp. mesenteroides]|uniref:restriction endonuclease subunit S n=1 Tax=Leuconostoc mesenteroides TaxID=1245 RepID=UPI0009914237|nr:restriction endonuclease subunit S [Leuconostoc mesenteroides]AQU49764.1 restriction endonuclease subunit S [Leuconostoc mesenteroides subsp. mesenteroides]